MRSLVESRKLDFSVDTHAVLLPGILIQPGWDEHCYIRRGGPSKDPNGDPMSFGRVQEDCYVPNSAINYMYPSFDNYKIVFNGSGNAGQLAPEVGGDIMMKVNWRASPPPIHAGTDLTLETRERNVGHHQHD